VIFVLSIFPIYFVGLVLIYKLSFSFDIDPLLEVDDEHWENPTHPFQKPHGMPSRVAFFNTFMRLNHILGFCLTSLVGFPLSRRDD
jgi:hypothetical protein